MLTEAQQNYIKENYKTKEYKDIGITLNMSYKQVANWCERNKLRKIFKLESTKHIDVINDYISGLSKAKIAVTYGVAPSVVHNILIKNNIEIKSAGNFARKYQLNVDTFKTIDTYEKAYWLGFLSGDCYINKKHNKLVLSLAYVDKHHVEDFRKFIEADNPLRIIQPARNLNWGSYNISSQCSLIITNREFVEHLVRAGCGNKKSFNLAFPNSLYINLLPAFVLGIFDADGTVSQRVVNSNNIKLRWSVIGSTKFIQDLQNTLIEKLGVKRTKLHKEKRVTNGDMSYVYYSGIQDLEKIYHYLYDNATVWLERKRKKFYDYLTLKGCKLDAYNPRPI